MSQTKLCKNCSRLFAKRRFCSKRNWKFRKKFCSKSCLIRYQLSTSNFGVKTRFKSGEANLNWKGGIRNTRRQRLKRIRMSDKYKLWRFKIFKRDNFTCQECGKVRGGVIEAHHKKSFTYFPRLRFRLSNGITLCQSCHKKTDNYGYKSKPLKKIVDLRSR